MLGEKDKDVQIPGWLEKAQRRAAEKTAEQEASKERRESEASRRQPVTDGWLFVYTRRHDEHGFDNGPFEVVRIKDEYTARHLFYEARSGHVRFPWEEDPVPINYFMIARMVDHWDWSLKERAWMDPRRVFFSGIRLCRVCDTYHYTHDERRMCPEYAREIGEPFDVTFAEVRRWREQRQKGGK